MAIQQWRHFGATLLVILLPMLCIVLQRETGSALVYLSFFLMFYREGMPGSILFTGIAMVVYFVVGIRFAEVPMGSSSTMVGPYAVMVYPAVLHRHGLGLLPSQAGVAHAAVFGGCHPALSAFVELRHQYRLYSDGAGCLSDRLPALPGAILTHPQLFLYRPLRLGSGLFYYGADFIMQNVMEPHQRSRINVLLGLDEDLRGAGYNVHQSEIAIGSGGLQGKGFLNGTQTKLKFVPEQDTDFIFCTVGEEEGFLGSAGVLLLFLALIWRLIYLSERQPMRFGRVYGYCVLSIFLFHVFINVGMVLGLTPVIGIPLPFFSYGGSSLWGFTLLLFIFLRLDASRRLS